MFPMYNFCLVDSQTCQEIIYHLYTETIQITFALKKYESLGYRLYAYNTQLHFQFTHKLVI